MQIVAKLWTFWSEQLAHSCTYNFMLNEKTTTKKQTNKTPNKQTNKKDKKEKEKKEKKEGVYTQ